LDPLVENLSTLPRLRHVELSCCNQKTEFPFLSTSSLEILLSVSTSLQSLTLCKLGLQDDHFDTIADQLRENTTLEYLNLNGNLATNVGLEAIMESLDSQNHNLKHVCLKHAHVFEPGGTRLHTMLNNNLTLQVLQLENLDDKQQRQVDFFLGLNRVGRRTIFHSTAISNGFWPFLLEKVQHDCSALFYFLTAFPDMFVSSQTY
jgi:hypothetical protein